MSELRLRTSVNTSDQLILDYLDHALSTVYWSKAAVNMSDRVRTIELTNADLSKLRTSGSVSGWPRNPFNGWRPMRVLTPDDPFSAGDLVFQLCPASASSNWQNTELPLSFALSIYGPDKNFATKGHAAAFQDNSNANWTVVPEGSVFMLSMHVPPSQRVSD